MAVYVDDMRAKYRRMVMCHMIADTVLELHFMADNIGVARRHFQQTKSGPHYDICLSYKSRAVARGAIQITQREAAAIMWCQRFGLKYDSPAHAKVQLKEWYKRNRVDVKSPEHYQGQLDLGHAASDRPSRVHGTSQQSLKPSRRRHA